MNDFIQEDFHSKTGQESLELLDTDISTGLSSQEAEERSRTYGLNQLEEKKKPGFFSKLIAQFSDFLIIILIVAAVISFVIGAKKDAIVIISIVIVNALLGIYQEGKAEKSLESLQKMTSSSCKVLRNGSILTIPASQLVPGDLVYLDAGDIIPADLRLIESANLKVEESSLTGESVPVEKDAEAIFDSETGLADRENLGYMGTVVTYGRGKGLVIYTGDQTEIGKIAKKIQSYEDELTPLQEQLNHLGKVLGMVTLLICGLVFALGIFQGQEVLDMFMISVSLAVAAIPEGLPAIVTIVLSIGMNRMVKRNAIVKKLLAVETLGATTVICSDKTGTLTENQMTVVKTYVDNKVLDVTGNGYNPRGDFLDQGDIIARNKSGNLETLLAAAALANDASLVEEDGAYKIIGDPTEGALITLAQKANYNKELMNKEYKRIGEIPFDSTRKMMTSFHENYIPGGIISFTKGAPDIIIDRCDKIAMGDKVLEFSDNLKEMVLKQNSEFSQSALRVLAFSYNYYETMPEDPSPEINENNMTFIGLVGMIDPARKEAKAAIDMCREAGIRTVMITGDYKETAYAIAKNLGIAERESQAIMGADLDKYTDEELRTVVENVNVYARVSPDHKVRIIEALKANGEVTSMTGDGVNDALALKRADIGVAMGITGTDVAKNTADLILTDDNFASIVAAVEEGRIIYSNIKKFVFFLLSCNIGEIFLVLSSIILKLPVPLIPIQLLWLNLVTDSFPALALGVEPGEPDIMKQAPRKSDEAIISKSMGVRVFLQSITIGLASLLAFKFGLSRYPTDINKARTIVFATLILSELLRSYSSRSEHFTVFKIGIFSNKTLVRATLVSFLLLLVTLYVPFVQPIFNTFPLGLAEWKIVVGLALVPFAFGELVKLFISKSER